MSEVKAFTKEERARLLRGLKDWKSLWVSRHTLPRYEATVAKVEAERDALKVDLNEAQERCDELQDEVWDLTGELVNIEEGP